MRSDPPKHMKIAKTAKPSSTKHTHDTDDREDCQRRTLEASTDSKFCAPDVTIIQKTFLQGDVSVVLYKEAKSRDFEILRYIVFTDASLRKKQDWEVKIKLPDKQSQYSGEIADMLSEFQTIWDCHFVPINAAKHFIKLLVKTTIWLDAPGRHRHVFSVIWTAHRSYTKVVNLTKERRSALKLKKNWIFRETIDYLDMQYARDAWNSLTHNGRHSRIASAHWAHENVIHSRNVWSFPTIPSHILRD